MKQVIAAAALILGSSMAMAQNQPVTVNTPQCVTEATKYLTSNLQTAYGITQVAVETSAAAGLKDSRNIEAVEFYQIKVSRTSLSTGASDEKTYQVSVDRVRNSGKIDCIGDGFEEIP